MLCLLIDNTSLSYVVSHVSDMHSHLPKVITDRSNRESIVKILRIVRVNGAGKHIAHIKATSNLICWDDITDMVSRMLYGNRVFIGQTKLGKNGMHLGIIITSTTKDVYHVTYGIASIFGPINYFHDGLITTLSTLESISRDENIIIKCTTFCEKERIVSLHFENAHKGIVGTFKDLHNFTLRHSATTTSSE